MTGGVAEAGAAAEQARLLAAGRRAAFHAAPGLALAPLRTAAGLPVADGDARAGTASWLLGVALGACGRYGEAEQVLTPLLPEAPTAALPAPPWALPASLACSTLASHRRQLGRHAEAEVLDVLACRVAEPLGPQAGPALADALVGLVADAVGRGDAAAATRRLDRARTFLDSCPALGWRPRVRLGWVRAEVALLGRRGDVAAAAAEAALRAAQRARAPRHVAKSLLFLGVARAGADPAEAVALLYRASAAAEGLGALPLVWPCRAVLAGLLDAGDPRQAAGCRAVAAAAVRDIAAGLPDPGQAEWLARPDVAAVLASGG